MQIFFEEMSSWTPLTMYIGMKTTFQTKYIYSKYVRICIIIIFDFHYIIRKCILRLNYHKTPILWTLSCRELYFFKNALSSFTLPILNPHKKVRYRKSIIIKIRAYLLYIYLVSNVVFIPIYIVKGVQDDISSKSIRIWLRNATL